MSYHDDDTGDHSRRVVAAAARLLARRGSERSHRSRPTMGRLAAAAGMSRATLYRRVGRRDALVRRLAGQPGISAEATAALDARRRILRAAAVVFGRSGPLTATIEKIAAEAGMAPATVYRHFRSRAALLEAVDVTYGPVGVLATIADTPGREFASALTKFAVETLRLLHDNRGLVLVSFSDHRDPAGLVEVMRRAPARTIESLARFFRRRLPCSSDEARESATAFLGMLLAFAVVAPTAFGRPLADRERVARFVTRLFLEGADSRSKRRTRRRRA